MSRKKGLILSYIFFVLNAVSSIFVSAFLINRIGDTGYGVFQTVSSFASYLALLEFGIGTIMIRNISLCRKNGDVHTLSEHYSTVLFINYILSIFIVAISVSFYFLIPVFYSKTLDSCQIALGQNIFIFVSIKLIFSFICQSYTGVLIGFEHYSFDKLISLIVLSIRVLIVVLVFLNTDNIVFLSIIDMCLEIIKFVAIFIYIKIKTRLHFSFKKIKKTIFIVMIPLAIALLGQTAINTANNNVDKFLIGILLNPESVTLYSISMSIFAMYSSMSTIPIPIFMPKLASAFSKHNSNEIKNELLRASKISSLIGAFVCFGFVSFGLPFIRVVYGPSYSDAWIYAIIIIIPMFFNMSNAPIINILDLENKRQFRTLIVLFTTLVNVGLTIISLNLKQVGMIGAAGATGLCLMLQAILLNIYYKKRLNINGFYIVWKAIKGILLPSFISTASCLVISFFLKDQILSLTICSILYIVSFALIFYCFSVPVEEKKRIARRFKK